MAWANFAAGLGRFANAVPQLLFPGLGSGGVDPAVAQQLRSQALMQMGAGLASGQDIAKSYGLGQASGYEALQGYQRQQTLEMAKQDRTADQEFREWQKARALDSDKRQAQLDQVAMSDRIRERMQARERLELEKKRYEHDLANEGKLTPYQSAMLAQQGAAIRREEERQNRIDGLIEKQNRYLAKGGKRGDTEWMTYQDAIDNLSGRAVDRSMDPAMDFDGGAGPPPLTGALDEDEQPTVRRPPNAAAPKTATAESGLGTPRIELPAWAYTPVGEVNAKVGQGLGQAVTQDDSYAGRLNQQIAARLQGISWEEWRRRKGLPPVTR